MQTAERMKKLPPYLFAQIDELKKEMLRKGIDVLNLGIGDPDLPTPSHIISALISSANDPINHQYPTYSGLLEFRKAVADWYKKRFGVDLDPETEVVTLIGSKEGIAHIFLPYVDKGDYTLVVDPGYPVYKIGTILAGGEPISVPLLKENNFLPNLNEINTEIANKAKIFFINYPHNPTASICDLKFFESLVNFANKYQIIICHDAAYSEICFDGYKAPSFLQAKGAKEVGIEFHSLSKTYNMTGWRIGFAVGNKEVIKNLTIIKTNIDSGVFQAVQYAGITALTSPQDNIEKVNKIYQKRRDLVIETFQELGWNISPPLATFYIWLEVPSGYNSMEFSLNLLQKTGVLVVPGVGYGEYGEGYFRISLTVPDDKLKMAMEKIKKSGIRFK